MNDRLTTNETLKIGERLVSSNGVYQLILQNDGNLVLYRRKGIVKGGALWATRTHGKNATLAIMQSDGNFVLYGSKGIVKGGALWASHTNARGGALVVMQNDGNLVIYRSDGSYLWDTKTSEPDNPNPSDDVVYAEKKEKYICLSFSGSEKQAHLVTPREAEKEAYFRKILEKFDGDENKAQIFIDENKAQIFEKVKEIVVNQLKADPDEVKAESRFRHELRVYDELDFLELLMALEESFDIEIDYTEESICISSSPFTGECFGTYDFIKCEIESVGEAVDYICQRIGVPFEQ